MDTTGLNDYNQSGGRRLDRMNSFGSRGRVPESRRRPRLHVNRRNRRREPMSPPARKIPLRLSNSDGVWDFYLQRFKAIQQTACKLIAKAWIKAVAPRKQSTHPYTGQEIPAWWPRPWGSTQFEQVRHKEPDHLKKYGKRGSRLPLPIPLVVADIPLANLTPCRAHPSLCPHPAARHRAEQQPTPGHPETEPDSQQIGGGRTRRSVALLLGECQQRSQETRPQGDYEGGQDGRAI